MSDTPEPLTPEQVAEQITAPFNEHVAAGLITPSEFVGLESMIAARWVITRAEPTEEMLMQGPPEPYMDAYVWQQMLAATPSPLDDATLVEGMAELLRQHTEDDRDKWRNMARVVLSYLSAKKE